MLNTKSEDGPETFITTILADAYMVMSRNHIPSEIVLFAVSENSAPEMKSGDAGMES